MNQSVGPRLSIGLPVAGQVVGHRPAQLIEIAKMAEAHGVDTVVAVDHVVMGERFDRYRWGTFRFPQGTPWLEPLTLLSTVAGATTTLRLATGILIAPLRPATLLAKTAATLDQLSLGRLELGVGTGWQVEEYESMDVDFSQRAQVLDDTIEACQALWAPSPATVRTASVSFERIWCDPKPVQPGGPPILFSGELTRRNLDRISTHGQGWIPIMGAQPDDVADGIATIRTRWLEAGRDPDDLRVRMPVKVHRGDLASTLAGAPALVDAGVTEINVEMAAFVSTIDDAAPWFADLARRWAALW